ncbi:hydantoinase/oxoprolinase family protein [Baekduia soli]|uniref:hydantoinase/oxoprolinase family protein n=1 Tax=Baekduia soli TaxID=496014 RepID=UPI00165291A7|nr:hydantoinase/oxoprolinase family protein [Baekduia soli]
MIERPGGRVVTSKALSTPDDFAVGLFESIGRAAREIDLSVDEVMARTDQIIVGTTVGTNAFLERKGARTGLLTTRGFRDTLFIMRAGGRVIGRPPEDMLMLETTRKPEPLVPKSLIRMVHERVDSDGEILVPVQREQVMGQVAELVAEGVEAISICLLWSFKEPAHELAIRDWIREEHPGLYLACSHEVAPKLGELERFAGTTISAYVGPRTSRYLERIEGSLRERGYDETLLVMGCDGGVRSAHLAAREAIVTLNSGPAGGVTGSESLAATMGIGNVITADVGGTSFDVSVIEDGAVHTGSKTELGGFEFSVPAIDVQGIGAGGGSIAWIDPVRQTLRVGPESAGSDPGPVCYGQGGTRPTLTDAALALGYLSTTSFLGDGDRELDVGGARRALEELGAGLGLTWDETAAGVVRIAEAHMADLVRRMVVSRGHDPRDFSLFAFGGAGPVHAAGFARDLSLANVVIPAGNGASVWSAYGVATSDIKHVYEYSTVFEEPLDAGEIAAVYRRLGATARERLADEGIPVAETSFRYQGGLRYAGQLHEVYVAVPEPEELDEAALVEVIEAFEREYERVFGVGTGFRRAGVEYVDFRLTTVNAVDRPPLQHDVGDGPAARGERLVRFVGLGPGSAPEPISTPQYDGDAIPAATRIAGPAVIELPGTTVVVGPDYEATRHVTGSFVLTQVRDQEATR